ncbi:zinc-binding dehydrogenase [Martelella alba]|uniref:enoyl-[acyl-carrier-protein] reductase n=1 Tax=Martelella alba TaxID=2590451 RepID=A0A506TYB4_9HYPH|nr:zinc-binding dehydrogenase [Martelella alba]TPW27083.1 zinc-binding dehydrogenase [Martelella alba]
MKAAIHDVFGDPAEVLKCGTAARPQAAPGEVVLKVLLSPIHNHDLWTVRGSYGVKPALPAIGGSEAVGIIADVGEGVDPGLTGKRVAAAGLAGSWAEYVTASAASLIPLPDGVSDEIGAQLVAMPFSAITLLDFVDVAPGDCVVQTAANGAVGKVFAALASARGVKTVNLVRRQEAVAELEKLGVENVIATDQADWLEKAQALVGEKGARAAVDSVGGKMAMALCDLIGEDGLLVTFGTATGAPLALSSGTIIFKQLTVKGFWGKKVSDDMALEKKTTLFGELLRLAVSGALPLPVGGIFSLDEVADAARAALVPGRAGKILLKP